MAKHIAEILQTPEQDWVTFPGGELAGKRPKRLCSACRDRLRQSAAGVAAVIEARQPLCFQCYRLELDRERALKTAGELDTASEARFQEALPFEPVNQTRLSMLKTERVAARQVSQSGAGRFADRRRQAQIAARRALQTLAYGLHRHQNSLSPTGAMASQPHQPQTAAAARDLAFFGAVHAAELQLPESWLPFVVSR